MRTAKIVKERSVAFQEHQFEKEVRQVLGEKSGLLNLFQIALNSPDLTNAQILCSKIQKSSLVPEKEKGRCLRIFKEKIQGNSAESQQH
ncbi:MAG: hypothetical protein ChlgKO_08250 [Chlamydiales bacterium]